MAEVIYCKVPVSENNPGGLKIVVPAKGMLDVALEKDLPKDVISYHIGQDTDCPKDRYFRNAWDLKDDKTVSVDMEKARSIKIEKLRPKRDEMLRKLDADFMKALELGDTASQKSIADKKKKLRDMPDDASFNEISTPEALKDFEPEYMRG